jgi:PAS domain S-box-containing protein
VLVLGPVAESRQCSVALSLDGDSQDEGTGESEIAARRRVVSLDIRYLPLLLDVLDVGIFTIDQNGVITFFNKAAEEITGYRSDDVVGTRCAALFRTEHCATCCPLRHTMQSGEPVKDQRVVIQGGSGRAVLVSVTTAVLSTKDGAVLGGVEVLKDLSLVEQLRRQLDGRYRFEDIISRSPRMQEIFGLLPLVANSDSSLLIVGASGTGKELVARAIHHQSPRRDNPFVAVNCAAMPDTLIESELFGYVKGAFTDARRDKPGRIAQADGGTLFLDEIGDLPLAVQAKLLRFLQEMVYEPLGATFSTRADVRIVSATNKNLERMVESGAFRRDLYFRLNVMQIELPPLSERREDLPLLAQHFIERFRGTTGKPIQLMDERALAALQDYPFPGNVRELENLIERAFLVCRGSVITYEHLPPTVLRYVESRAAAPAPHLTRSTGGDPVAAAERQLIEETLATHGGNRSHAAAALGIHRSTLIRKLHRFGLDDGSGRAGPLGRRGR